MPARGNLGKQAVVSESCRFWMVGPHRGFFVEEPATHCICDPLAYIMISSATGLSPYIESHNERYQHPTPYNPGL